MSITVRRDPLGDMPSFIDSWQDQCVQRYQDQINEAIRKKCEDIGHDYRPERIILINDQIGNNLYYYQTDTGSLEPLFAHAQMNMKWNDDGNKLTVTLESMELHPDIFKPKI
jgi:hypothetical protein